MIEIEMLTKNPLYILKDTNCITIGKRAIKERKETFTEAVDYYKKMFIAEHSSIEWIDFRIVDDECRGDVASHIVRQTKSHPRFAVQSSRPDWNDGEPRKSLDKTIIKFTSKWNTLSFMQMCRQRLCTRASEVDRIWIKKVLSIMKNSKNPYFVALSKCCVPNCVYRGGCPELEPCPFNRFFFDNNISIDKRYFVYKEL